MFKRTTCDLLKGACGVRFTPTTAGPTVISASYSGDAFNSPSAGTFTLPVGMRASVITVSCSPAKVQFSATVTCKAKVTGYQPTGDVAWSQAGIGSVSFTVTTCPLTAGACSITMTASSPGTVGIVATYPGDSNNLASSRTATLTVGRASTHTDVSCVPSTFGVGDSIACTATVSGGSHSPTGTVTWSKVSGSGKLTFSSNTCTLSLGTCSVTVTGSVTGIVKIEASYSGDSNYLGSSGRVDLTIV
jgi:hypothetical protein